MLPDNRLDFITGIDELMIDSMSRIRERFIEIDEALRGCDEHANFKDSGAARTIALARTHLEMSLQFAIKSLCLLGEIKP